MTSALFTDRYELSMLCSVLDARMADTPAVFEVFARRLPPGRRFGLLAGVERVLDAVADFTFDDATLASLLGNGIVTPSGADYLRDWRFSGDIDGYAEGDLYWPGSPVLTVRGPLAEGFLLETVVLSIMNHDTAVASAAARMVLAAAGRPLIEMGSRRVDPQAAVAAARAAWLAGFAATSNLAAGERYRIPTTGTAAHSFTLAHASEVDAFTHQLRTHGTDTTLLVDTFDTPTGIRNAVAAARAAGAAGPGAIRIDSGDLVSAARAARALLDDRGATRTRIVVTSDLDEWAIADLAGAPVDSYGVGSRVVTGSGHPSAGFVYKLVAVGEPLRPVEKTAEGKASAGGVKTAYRTLDGDEHYGLDGSIPPGAFALQRAYVRGGRRVSAPTHLPVAARDRAAVSLAGLDASSRDLADGTPNRRCTRKEQPCPAP